MSFFKKRDEVLDTYKDKYLALLDSHDALEKQYKSDQELLCKTIIKLTRAIHGLNPAIDPYLDKIRSALKQGLHANLLKTELQTFTTALTRSENVPAHPQLDASLLFDFLAARYPSQRDEFDQILDRYKRQEYTNHQKLFLALADIIDKQANTADVLTVESTIANSTNRAITEHLWRIVDSIEIPEELENHAEQIKNQLHRTGHELVPIVDSLASLLLAARKHRERERTELANFLSTLTEELAEIGMKASGINIAYEDAHKKRDWLDQDVTVQMIDLQKKSSTATQLEPLKQLISIRLASISQQIQIHAQEEQREREATQRELRNLMRKVLDMESEVAELHAALDAAQRQALHDPLTKLPNRLAFNERLASEIARCKRYGTLLSLAVLDIDFFKNINDTYGHKSGDKALIVIAKLLNSHCRSSDFVARYGGEEFVMLLPETSGQQAFVVADKLREKVAESSFIANGVRVNITFSCGIAQFQKDDDNESLFARADNALYQAKSSGRNTCVLA